MKVKLSHIPQALDTQPGIPRPNWPVIGDWIDSNIAVDALDDAWEMLARDWLDILIETFPAGFTTSESRKFILLSSCENLVSDRILNWCEKSHRIIIEAFANVACDDQFGKYVVIAFEDTNLYYDYVADFYPEEGEFAMSGGIFLDQGFTHIAICMAYPEEHDRLIAHELSHLLLRHLPLPLWLDEGVAQFVEDAVVGSSNFEVSNETARRHRGFWNQNTIQSFYSGDSFLFPGDGQELSYHLSQVLFRNLVSDAPELISGFLNSANYSDAGDSALVDICGGALGERVEQFLGKGNWAASQNYCKKVR